ncbi:MAG TPA: hypothetical protein VJA26_00115 [Gammaproteobacteria bacterium]|nr:hypothetical protein [Gammaproteobacteria bacterium]
MNRQLYKIGMSSNPIVQVISLIVVGLALIVAVLMGAVILAAVFGLAMIAAIVIAIRIWWFRRKLRRAQPTGGALIEAEYTVVKERELRDRHERRD